MVMPALHVTAVYGTPSKRIVTDRYLVRGGPARMESKFPTRAAALDPYARPYISSNSVYRPGPMGEAKWWDVNTVGRSDMCR